MGATRFFVSGVFSVGDSVELAADDARKLRVVLRASSGDAIQVVDSSGCAYDADAIIDGQRVRARLRAQKDALAPPKLQITLAQGIPKGAKMDFVVEKATELGVMRLWPFASERTVGTAEREGKTDRWRRIATTAAQQCGRADVPTIEEPVAFAAVCARFGEFDRVLVAWELAEHVPLRERLPSLLVNKQSVLIVIGPEGGLSADEASRAERCEAKTVSLGTRILRTETAGLVVCSALLYAGGDL